MTDLFLIFLLEVLKKPFFRVQYLKLACDADSSEVVVSVVAPVVPGVEGFLEFAMAGMSSSESVRSTLWHEGMVIILSKVMQRKMVCDLNERERKRRLVGLIFLKCPKVSEQKQKFMQCILLKDAVSTISPISRASPFSFISHLISS